MNKERLTFLVLKAGKFPGEDRVLDNWMNNLTWLCHAGIMDTKEPVIYSLFYTWLKAQYPVGLEVHELFNLLTVEHLSTYLENCNE